MSACRLCLEEPNPNFWNEPLFESDNFIVLPSLGALVEGWLLLVPKSHFICFGALPESLIAEMKELKATVCSSVSKAYGNVAAFEHGPHKESLRLGCGVDHAHLHVVPIPFDLESAVAPFLPPATHWLAAGAQECHDAYLRREDYLYLEQPIGVGRIATHDDFGGQLFRRGIAAALGLPDEYNWREHSHLSNVAATTGQFRGRNLFSDKRQSELAA
jgi:ATP adenylyltransferase